MPPQLAELQQFYLELRAYAAAGQIAPDDAKRQLAERRVVDAAGNTWFVDPNSPADHAQFLVQDRAGQILPGTPDVWRAAVASPLPTYDPTYQHQSFGPGQPPLPRGPLPDNLPDVDTGADDEDDESAVAKLRGILDPVASRLPGGMVTLLVAVGVVLFAVIYVVNSRGSAGTGDQPTVPAGSQLALTEACFTHGDDGLSDVACNKEHTAELISVTGVKFAVGADQLCAETMPSVPVASGVLLSPSAGVWMPDNGGTLLCQVSLLGPDGNLMPVKSSVIDAAGGAAAADQTGEESTD